MFRFVDLTAIFHIYLKLIILFGLFKSLIVFIARIYVGLFILTHEHKENIVK